MIQLRPHITCRKLRGWRKSWELGVRSFELRVQAGFGSPLVADRISSVAKHQVMYENELNALKRLILRTGWSCAAAVDPKF